VLPRLPVGGWLADFGNKTENSNDIADAMVAMHRDPDKTQPVDTVIIPNNAELGGRARGTIRSKRFHSEHVKGAAVLRMDVPQDRLKFGRFAWRYSE
jgi:hypothetical protein